MDSSHQTHLAQNFRQSAFQFYNPNHRVEQINPEHFSSSNVMQESDHFQQFQVQNYQQEISRGQSSMVFHRPSSSGSHVYLHSKPQIAIQPTLTPLASPRPIHQKPSFLYQHDGQQLSVNTSCNAPELYVYPSTPPLSVSGSVASTPPSSCGILQTPGSGACFTLENIEGVKEGCEGDVKSEILAGGDWTRSRSPPLKPGKHILSM